MRIAVKEVDKELVITETKERYRSDCCTSMRKMIIVQETAYAHLLTVRR